MAKLEDEDLLLLTEFFIASPEIATPATIAASAVLLITDATWTFGAVPALVNAHNDGALIGAILGTLLLVCLNLYLYLYWRAVEKQIEELLAKAKADLKAEEAKQDEPEGQG